MAELIGVLPPLATLVLTMAGGVTSGPAAVWKCEVKLKGLPTGSRMPLSVITRLVLAGSGALGTNSTLVSSELIQKLPGSGVPPFVTWKLVLFTLTGSMALLKTTPGCTLTPTLVAPL